MAESAVNSTEVVPWDCCHCAGPGQALQLLSDKAASDKDSAESAIASCSSGCATMVVLGIPPGQHGGRWFWSLSQWSHLAR